MLKAKIHRKFFDQKCSDLFECLFVFQIVSPVNYNPHHRDRLVIIIITRFATKRKKKSKYQKNQDIYSKESKRDNCKNVLLTYI